MLNFLYKTLAVIILLLLFFVAGGGISHYSKWRVEQIRVEGTNELNQNKLREFTQEKLQGNYFFMYARENSYLFPRGEIERGILDEFPQLKSVKVERIDKHTLLVSVVERSHFSLWCGEEFLRANTLENCWFIDDTGFIFERAPTFSTGVYLEVYGTLERVDQNNPLRAVLPKERFEFALSFVRELQKEKSVLLRIFIKSEGEYGVVINSNERSSYLRDVEVLFKEGQDPTILIKNLFTTLPIQFPEGIVLKKKLLYADLRFGNKVFFGFEK